MIYISGKMTGVKDFNYPEFNRIANGLRSAGHKVINPVDIAYDLATDDYDKILEADLKAIEKCHTICLLKGWETSKGARLELKRAIELNLNIVQQGDFI